MIENPTLDVEVACAPLIAKPLIVVVPKPIDETESCVAVDEPTTNPIVSPASGFTERRANGVVVPIPRFPKKYDVAVVVAMRLPTVSCVPVAMSAPAPFDVMIELIAYVPADAHVALYNSPVALVFRQPAVDVARDIAPVVPLIVNADVDVVAVPATVVVDR